MTLLKLLLDENLSPFVAISLQKAGIDAVHVRDRGMLGATDVAVLDRAFHEDRLVVTSNVDDFRRLASARSVHAGVVLIEERGLTRDEQLAVVTRACVLVASEQVGGRDMVNRVLRIWFKRQVFEDLPPT